GSGAGLGSVLDHAAEPAVEKKNRAVPRLAVAAVGLAHVIAQAADRAGLAADVSRRRLRNRRISHADWIVEIGFQEGQQFGSVVAWKRLVGEFVSAAEKADASAVVAARAGRERDRKQHPDPRMLCRYPQLQPVS